MVPLQDWDKAILREFDGGSPADFLLRFPSEAVGIKEKEGNGMDERLNEINRELSELNEALARQGLMEA